MESTNFDLIVVGASAGGVEALATLVSELPGDLPAAMLIVQHLPAYHRSVLPDILARAGALPVRHPHDQQVIEPGHIYVAPPDHHLLVERVDGKAMPEGSLRVRLSRGAKQNGYRPAVDSLFQSAARACGQRVIGVILSGALDDGSAGMHTIKRCGGTAVVQDPAEAVFSGMPESALESTRVDFVLPLRDIAQTLARLAGEAHGEEAKRNAELIRGIIMKGNTEKSVT